MAIIVDSPAHLSTKTAVFVDESRRPFYRRTPMPLLAWILSKLGLVDKDMLKKYRKYAVVVLLVLGIYPSLSPLRTLYRPCRSQTGTGPRTGE